MTVTMKELGVDRLSPQQRVALALEIWESLGEDRPRGRLTTEQRAELAVGMPSWTPTRESL